MLTKEQIVQALEALDRELAKRGVRGEVCLVGGAVMSLVYDARPATKYVDAWFAPTTEMREAAARVASELNLPTDWLNDAAKGFISERANFVSWQSLPSLEIRVADTRTMLAMKCLAARSDQDAADIRVLATKLGLSSPAAIMDTIAGFYDPARLEVDCPVPAWFQGIVSPEPYFAFGAKSFELRVRLMIDSPPAFKLRRVFVPNTFLDRA